MRIAIWFAICLVVLVQGASAGLVSESLEPRYSNHVVTTMPSTQPAPFEGLHRPGVSFLVDTDMRGRPAGTTAERQEFRAVTNLSELYEMVYPTITEDPWERRITLLAFVGGLVLIILGRPRRPYPLVHTTPGSPTTITT